MDYGRIMQEPMPGASLFVARHFFDCTLERLDKQGINAYTIQ